MEKKMEYIQCTNCDKKYDVNDKIRAAEGKYIRCKGCSKKFEIKVFSEDSPVTHKASTESARCIVCNNLQKHKSSFAGKQDSVSGKLLPGNDGVDYLCPTCMTSFRHGKLIYPSDSNIDAEVTCMVCRSKKGYKNNYAGQINKVKGNLFPGDKGTDYLCKACKIELEGDDNSNEKNDNPIKHTKLILKKHMTLLVVGIVVLLIGSWAAGLFDKGGTVNGEVFVVTEGQKNINLAMVEVIAMTEEDMFHFLSELKQEYDSMMETIRNEPEQLLPLMNVISSLDNIYLPRRFSKRMVVVRSNSDGKFSIHFSTSGEYYLMARAERKLPRGGKEEYFWIVRTSIPSNASVLLSNQNMLFIQSGNLDVVPPYILRSVGELRSEMNQ